jgi:soluble lytic murein transglycosylase-like protein
LEDAFDPLANALYAARFLRVLLSHIGEWPAAVAAYHSQTREGGAAYQGKVLAIWTPPGLGAPAGPDSRPA